MKHCKSQVDLAFVTGFMNLQFEKLDVWIMHVFTNMATILTNSINLKAPIIFAILLETF